MITACGLDDQAHATAQVRNAAGWNDDQPALRRSAREESALGVKAKRRHAGWNRNYAGNRARHLARDGFQPELLDIAGLCTTERSVWTAVKTNVKNRFRIWMSQGHEPSLVLTSVLHILAAIAKV